jgi:SlyX protein
MTDPHHDDDHRLMDLEVKVAFMDDLVEQLNDIVARQQRQIDRLVREVVQLQNQLQDSASGSTARNLRDELPPHY